MNEAQIKETDLDQEMLDKLKPLRVMSTPRLKVATKQHIFAAASERCQKGHSTNIRYFRFATAAALVIVGTFIFTFSPKDVPNNPPPVAVKSLVVEKPVVLATTDESLDWDYSIDTRSMSRKLVSLHKKCFRNGPKSGMRQRIWRRKLNKRRVSII